MDIDQLPPKAVEILDVAEAHMRRGGFDAVSYRDLAAATGIKSASVHYHFPQKAQLGEAVVARYAQRVLGHLGVPDDPDEGPALRLRRLVEVYATALNGHDAVCLCCVLGAASPDLPPRVQAAVADFYRGALRWTNRALQGNPAGVDGAEAIAQLQGAMILSVTLEDASPFERAARLLVARVDGHSANTEAVMT